ncbi:hypothetical protein, partial [Caballeronia choica]|jgi:hypothetical protein|uniref:hypothetical protein n=1 Tax=Caballeronia choica TaxID=326476 RepID=UPI001F3A5258
VNDIRFNVHPFIQDDRSTRYFNELLELEDTWPITERSTTDTLILQQLDQLPPLARGVLPADDCTSTQS